MYDKYFLLDTDTVLDYCRDRLGCFGANARLRAEEIGDGNINYVFRVLDESAGKSVIIKQADKLLRSSARPLDPYRSRIEAEALVLEYRFAPGQVPKVYNYDESMFAIAMEDISAYKNLRKELMAGRIYNRFAEDITGFLSDTLLPTTDMVMDRQEKKRLVQAFTNTELCDISEDLVFTEPYYNYKSRNIISRGNEDFVSRHLYNDKKLKCEVAKLRHRFMNYNEALIHGDLHSGSIFINDSGIKVIDPEFAFYGPIGYDVGNVLGNMFLALAASLCANIDKYTFISWCEHCIADIVDRFIAKFSEKYDRLVTFPLYNSLYKKDYIRELIADSVGYAGTEMIRRTVGDSKVAEITGLPLSESKLAMERKIIKVGIEFIMHRYDYSRGEELVETYKLCSGE